GGGDGRCGKRTGSSSLCTAGLCTGFGFSTFAASGFASVFVASALVSALGASLFASVFASVFWAVATGLCASPDAFAAPTTAGFGSSVGLVGGVCAACVAALVVSAGLFLSAVRSGVRCV